MTRTKSMNKSNNNLRIMKYLTLTALLPVLWSCSQPGADKHDAPPHKCSANSGKIASVSAIAPQSPMKGANDSAMARSNFERYWLRKARAYGRESVENGSFADSKQHARTNLKCISGCFGFPYVPPFFQIFPDLGFYRTSKGPDDCWNYNYNYNYISNELLNRDIVLKGSNYEFSDSFRNSLFEYIIKTTDKNAQITSMLYAASHDYYLIHKTFNAQNGEEIRVEYIILNVIRPSSPQHNYLGFKCFKIFGKWHDGEY